MTHWLQSLSEYGFDVFIVVYLAALHLVYHYLNRWFMSVKINKIIDRIDALENEIWDIFKDMEEK